METTTPQRRVLLVLDEAIAGPELRDQVAEKLGSAASVFVVAPALASSGLKHELGDIDGALAPARERLKKSLHELHEAGIDAAGEVGDSDPVLAINDELQKFPADEIVLVAHRSGQEAYAEKGLLERLDRDFEQPVTELLVDAAPSQDRAGEVRTTESGAGRDKEGTRGYGIPLIRQDAIAIAVGVAGTAVLVGLAAGCASGNESIAGACAAKVLIATAAILINLAHIVGLILFQSVRYRGLWERFLARLTVAGTLVAVAVAVSLAL
jgi:hypothetical protein